MGPAAPYGRARRWPVLAALVVLAALPGCASPARTEVGQCPLPRFFPTGGTSNQCLARNWTPQSPGSWTHEWDARFRLPMGWSVLDHVTQLQMGTALPADGLYIFVYRLDSKLLVRRSDRPDDKGCFSNGDKRYSFPANPEGNNEAPHMFVRHTQLNGGYQSVWSAGQLEIHDGKVLWISNASGHFAPIVQSLDWVEAALVDEGLVHPGQIRKHPNDWRPNPADCR